MVPAGFYTGLKFFTSQGPVKVFKEVSSLLATAASYLLFAEVEPAFPIIAFPDPYQLLG